MVALGAELDLLRPLVPGRAFLEAEVAWAVRHELALSLDDVLVAADAAGPGAPRSRRGDRAAGRRRSWAPISTGATRASRLEVDAYLAAARREFSVAPPGEPARRRRRRPSAGD